MSVKLYCCLCCTSGINEYKYLQNDSGECNEIYEITVKYFDPMLLTEHIHTACSKQSSVLCVNCWVHIQDFHDFQQTVMETRTSLEQINIDKSPLRIKVEEHQVTAVFSSGYNTTGNEELVQLNEVLIKNDLENQNHLKEDVLMSNDDDDDEKPLNKLIKKTQKPTEFSKESYRDIHKKENNLEKKQKPKFRKMRKSKFSTNDSKIVGSDGVGDDENVKRKKNVKGFAKDPGCHPALEKGREYDKFIEEWKSKLDCDICSETFPTFEILKVHFKEKHNAKGFVKCCDRKFDRRCSLVEHIRLHINPEMHKCDICGKLSGSKYNLKLHKKTIHEESQQFECGVCSKTFKQKQNLESHMLTHATGNKDFKCNDCGKGYVLESQLKKHIKLVHIDNRVCDQCGKTLHSIGALKNHLKEHSGIEKPKYPCDQCGTVLGSNSSLKSHKAAYHNDGSTVYVCSICGKVSATERGLKNHKKYVHEIERKHKCPHCDKAFKRPKNLQEHIAIHTGEVLYQCPHCPRSFKMHSKYHEHLKKAHPIEWEEGRKNRLEKQKIDYERVTNQVVI